MTVVNGIPNALYPGVVAPSGSPVRHRTGSSREPAGNNHLTGQRNAAAQAPSAPVAAPPVSPVKNRTELQALVDQVNQALRERANPHHEVSLVLKGEDEDTWVIEVREQKSDRLIVQYPPEAILHLRARIKELTGMVLDQKS